jgi:hypothetical protein
MGLVVGESGELLARELLFSDEQPHRQRSMRARKPLQTPPFTEEPHIGYHQGIGECGNKYIAIEYH